MFLIFYCEAFERHIFFLIICNDLDSRSKSEIPQILLKIYIIICIYFPSSGAHALLPTADGVRDRDQQVAAPVKAKKIP